MAQEMLDPMAPASRERPLTVLAYTVYITCDIRWQVVGGIARIYGRVNVDGYPADVEVIIQKRTGAEPWTEVARVRTIPATGTYAYDWLIGYADACYDWEWRALEARTGISSTTIFVAGAHFTELTLTAPAEATPGESITVSGRLRYEDAPGVWVPISGASIPIYVDGVLKGTVTTGADGSYSLIITAPTTSGTYTIRATYAGTVPGAAAAFAILGFQVGLPPELQPLVQYASYALAALPVLAVVGAVGYAELTKRR